MVRQTPAAVRFLSLEPLLGPIRSLSLESIDWVIVGGESGHGARRLDAGWVGELRDQCADAGVAFFFKQLGSVWARDLGVRSKGTSADDIPEEFLVRQYPAVVAPAV